MLILLLLFTISTQDPRNLALRHPTSTMGPGVLVDGDRTTHSDNPSCSFHPTSSWWSVDLHSEHEVSTVIVFLREDYCYESRGDLGEVFVGEILCGKLSGTTNPIYVNCYARGSSITIKFIKEIVLCEVEVIGGHVPVSVKFKNPDKTISIKHGESLLYHIDVVYPKVDPAPILTISPTFPNLYIREHTLVITEATRSLEGDYTIVSVDKNYKIITDVITLEVTGESPRFVVAPPSIATNTLSSLQITCVAVGHPTPHLELSKVIDSFKKVLFTKAVVTKDDSVSVLSFVIESPIDDDSGMYIVSAENVYGECQHQIIVVVDPGHIEQVVDPGYIKQDCKSKCQEFSRAGEIVVVDVLDKVEGSGLIVDMRWTFQSVLMIIGGLLLISAVVWVIISDIRRRDILQIGLLISSGTVTIIFTYIACTILINWFVPVKWYGPIMTIFLTLLVLVVFWITFCLVDEYTHLPTSAVLVLFGGMLLIIGFSLIIILCQICILLFKLLMG